MGIARTLAQHDMVCYDLAVDKPNLNALVLAGALSMPDEFWDTLEVIHKAATKRILFLPHAINQMNAPDRMISTKEVRSVIFEGSIVENYPNDSRGHSCLILGVGDNKRPIHVVCAPKSDYLAIITAYLPNKHQWRTDWRTRR
jgi:hypothetical protein